MTGIARHSLFVFILMLGSSTAFAGKSNLMLFPTEVIFGPNDRSMKVTITNTGDATGIFEMTWFDSTMNANGSLQLLEQQPAWSLQPYIRFSPRRVVLKPGQHQVVKMALRRSNDIPEGEYFSHLKVLTLNDNADKPAAESTDGVITIKARTAVSVPVIWRNSAVQPGATFEQVRLDRASNQIHLDVARAGKLSTRGRVKVELLGEDEPRKISEPLHTIIYPMMDSKSVSIPLTVPVRSFKPDARISISYTHGEGQNQRLIEEQTFDLDQLLQ